MPEDLKLSQIGSSPLPPPFRGLHSPGVRKHCQIIFACYFRKSSIGLTAIDGFAGLVPLATWALTFPARYRGGDACNTRDGTPVVVACSWSRLSLPKNSRSEIESKLRQRRVLKQKLSVYGLLSILSSSCAKPVFSGLVPLKVSREA